MEKNAHVLVVDDDEGILRLAQRLLERVGYRVSTAPSAEGAREVVGRDTPDLLVLDYQLGTGETGLDFFRRLRAEDGAGAKVPAILVTGFTDEARVIEALRSGVADVVPKAGDYLEYLPQAVERVLSQSRMAEQVAEAELIKEREGYYRTLAEILPQLVWTCLADGNCDFLSKQWVEYTGIAEQEQLGLRWMERVVHPEDQGRVREAWEAAVAGRAAYDLEYRIRRHDGAWRWFKTRGVALRDREGRVLKWFGTCTDVHDQREALEERGRLLAAEQRARQQAEEANRAKDQFLAMLSHELRTPLTPVLAAVRLLDGAGNLPMELKEEAQIIRRNVELEARLIDDLLDLTRVAKGKLQLGLETVDVHAAVGAVLGIFREEIQAKGLRVYMIGEAKRHHVRADYARLQQMLWNLIKNAAKFTPEQGEIFIHTRNGDGVVQVEVRDTGIGIEPENLGRLFNAFEQANVEVTKRYGGLGLGLAITKSLAELHGGRVWAKSEGLGKGATFTLELPVVNGVEEPEKDAGEKPAERRPLRILLVEDHADTAAVMSRLMKRLGHEVVLAGTVQGALAEWEGGGRFDLLMSDVGLPDGSGLDVMRAIREAGSDVPAIALTGFGMEEDVQRCLRAGFTAHLTKPIDFARLEGLVSEMGHGGTLKAEARV